MFFLGRYEYAMDERGRVPVPPRYREPVAAGAVLGQGSPDRCLRLYTEESFEQEAALYTSEPATRRAGRITRHAFFARSFPVDVDRQGRILVPAALPSILAGMKIGWAFAWRTLIGAELVFGASSGSGGLGWYIFESSQNIETDGVFAGLFMVILIGIIVENVVFRNVELRTVNRWGMQR